MEASKSKSIEMIWNTAVFKILKYKKIHIMHFIIVVWSQFKMLLHVYKYPIEQILEELCLFMIDLIEEESKKYKPRLFKTGNIVHASVTINKLDKVSIIRENNKLIEYSIRYYDEIDDSDVILTYNNKYNSMHCIYRTKTTTINTSYGDKLKVTDKKLYNIITKSFKRKAFQISSDSSIILSRLKKSKII